MQPCTVVVGLKQRGGWSSSGSPEGAGGVPAAPRPPVRLLPRGLGRQTQVTVKGVEHQDAATGSLQTGEDGRLYTKCYLLKF